MIFDSIIYSDLCSPPPPKAYGGGGGSYLFVESYISPPPNGGEGAVSIVSEAKCWTAKRMPCSDCLIASY